jgi:hypothetical protein
VDPDRLPNQRPNAGEEADMQELGRRVAQERGHESVLFDDPEGCPLPGPPPQQPIQHEPELRFTPNGTAVANFRSLRWATAKPERAANGKGKGDECNDEPNF